MVGVGAEIGVIRRHQNIGVGLGLSLCAVPLSRNLVS